MATIITKNSSTTSAVPLAGSLVQGELAVNVTDKKVYTKDSANAVVKLVGSLGNQEANAVAITGGTLTGVSLTGITDLAVAEGGTGASDAATARTNLGAASTGGTLAQFASTTSAQLAGVISDETGTGSLVFNNAPTITNPTITGGTITGVSVGGSANINVQRFSGNGVTTAFTLSSNPVSENNTQVYINGVYQQKDTYSVVGTTLTFSEAPVADTDNIEVITISMQPIGTTTSDLVSYTPAGTGAVATDVQSKLRESVSVKDFGAVGDGATDDAAAIQAAIDHAALVYGEVLLPRGAYKISTSIELKTTVSIKGDGQDASEIRYYGTGGTALKLEGTFSNQLTKVNLRDFSVYDYGTGVNGVNMVQCHYSTLSNMRIYGFTNGVSLQNCWNDLFTFVTADANTQDGFNFASTDANALQLIGCQGLANGRAGLYTEGGRAVIAVGSTFEANTQYGVYIAAGAANRPLNYTFTGCYIEGNGTYEVYCDSDYAYDPRGIIFRDCYFEAITGKASVAIRVVDSFGFVVDGCTFDNQGATYSYSLYAAAGGNAQNIVWGRNVDTSTNGVYMEVAYSDATKNEAFAAGRFTISGGVVDSANTYNITSITVIGTGIYEVTLKKAAKGSAYVINASCENGAAYVGMLCNPGQPISSTVFRILTATDASTLAHARTVNFTVFDL